MMKGIIGLSVWNVVITGVIALVVVWAWNSYAAGHQVAGVPLARV